MQQFIKITASNLKKKLKNMKYSKITKILSLKSCISLSRVQKWELIFHSLFHIYMGERDLISFCVMSGCQISMIKINLKDSACCQTSCSKESSNIITLPSSHVLTSSPHLSLVPLPVFGMTSPKCILNLQLVGPVWGHTCVPGIIMLYLICPRLHPAAWVILDTRLQVFGVL